MINKNFEVYKLKRELKRSGKDYCFTRLADNEYKEPLGDVGCVGKLKGLYHERSEHISVAMSDATQVRTKKIPSILCLYGDVCSIGLTIGDRVVINGKTMIVNGVIDIQEWGLISDISLEVVDNGV